MPPSGRRRIVVAAAALAIVAVAIAVVAIASGGGTSNASATSPVSSTSTVVIKRQDLKVERGRTYHERIVRRGGLLRWEQDGQLVLEMNDRAPLPLKGHDRFGFSSWQNDTYFDNLKIDPL